MSIWTLLYLLAASMCVWTAGEYVVRGRQSACAFVVTLVSVAVVEAGLGIGLSMNGGAPTLFVLRGAIGFAALPGPLGLHFAAEVTDARWPSRRVRAGLVVIGAGLAIASLCGVGFSTVRRTSFGWVAVGGLWMGLIAAYMFACLVPMFWLLGRGILRAPRLEARRFTYIGLGFAIAALAAADFLPAAGWANAPSGFVPIMLATLVLSYSIQERPLADLSTVAANTIGWTAVSALLLVPLLALFALSRDWSGWHMAVPATVAFYAIFQLVRLHLSHVQPAIDGAFQRRRRDLEGAAAAFAERVAVLHSASELAREVASALEEGLYVRMCAFALAPATDVMRSLPGVQRNHRTPWTVVLSSWGRVPPPEPDDPLLGYLRDNPEILLREALAHGEAQPVAAQAERIFARYGAAALLPLADRSGSGELRGLVMVGPRDDGRPFSDLELELLQRIKTATTAALVATRLYDRLSALHEELEAKVSGRTTDLEQVVAELRGAQEQLVQQEKMSSLGLLVSGMSAALVSDVEAAWTSVPLLRAHLDALVAGVRGLPLPVAPEAVQRERVLKLDFVLADLGALAEAIEEGARRARAVARDLQHFSRSDEEVPEEADVHALLDSSLNLLRHELRDRVEVVRRYAPDLPRILCFPGPLAQVFLNLLMNAEQAIEGAGRIEIETRAVEGIRVEVLVRDTGKGIPAHLRGRVFEPFFTTKPMGGKGGSGLGLAISYGIVERHGGRIALESEEGRGTELRVLLPISPAYALAPRRSLDPRVADSGNQGAVRTADDAARMG